MKLEAIAADDFLLSLPAGVRVENEDGPIRIVGRRAGLRLDGPMRALAPVLPALAEGATQADLIDRLDDPSLLPLFLYLVAQLDGAGLLSRTAVCGRERLATLTPIAGRRVLPETGIPAAARWVLSRFAFLRSEGDGLVLQSPLSIARLDLHHPAAAAILQRLSSPSSVDDLADRDGIGRAGIVMLIALLAGGGFIEPEAAGDGGAARTWEFHDLLFHWRTRLGRHDDPYGGVYMFAGEIEPLPSLKPAGEGERVAFPAAPDGGAGSAPLASLMDRRRSIRVHGAEPISLAQLGALLHRSARQIRSIDTAQGELAVRPYPAGGALYELELYLAVDRCDGLERGLYHYRPGEHGLERVAEPGTAFEALLDQAAATLVQAERPQILIVVTARFQRLTLKYRSVAYALVLKHVGVLYQTLYLVATDLGLAPCAMGGGDSMLFAEATGLDPLVESSVGEFALGTPGDPGADEEPPQ